MVHAYVRPALQRGWLLERPSPARITAISGVIALHAAAFVLLLMPMAAQDPPPVRDERVVPFQPIRKRPLIVPVQPQREERRTPVRAPRPVPPTPPQPPVVVAQGPDVAPPPGPIVDEVPTEPVIEAGPVALERLDYASAPPPPYPREAARRRIEGTVLLRVLVGADGTPLDVSVASSSGHRVLDEAARKCVLGQWRFRPAMQGGVAVQAVGIVPIRFSMR